jgi:DNA (cytosine-5)-methyltransferase 1
MIPTYYEFFAGGGMVRAALTPDWKCLFANDIDPKKGGTYTANWGNQEFKLGDIYDVKVSDLPGRADLAWASFPCQDLSLAGAGAGLKGERSGTFWGFWTAIHALKMKRRAPRVLVLENVCGTLTSHGGRDFAEICAALASLNYDFGAVVIDAALFVPQSRPRLFVVAVLRSEKIPEGQQASTPSSCWHPRALQSAHQLLPPHVRKRWIWWKMPQPRPRRTSFADLVETDPRGVEWHTPAETARLLNLMSPTHRMKVATAKKTNVLTIGTIYKRTRKDQNGKKIQRAEVRFDEIAGCLRTPSGGSSRQLLLIVERRDVRSRLLSPREAARLMGLSENYILPKNYNESYHLAGDGVVVPAVRHLADHLIRPMIADELISVAAE